MTVDIKCAGDSCNENLYRYLINSLVKLERKYKRLKGSKVLFNDIEDIEGKRKSCEIKLNVSGREIFASSRNTNFESAAKETLKVLYKHLHNHYETLTD